MSDSEARRKKLFAAFLRRLLESRGDAPESMLGGDGGNGNESTTKKKDAARRALDKILQKKEVEIGEAEQRNLEAIIAAAEYPTIPIFEDQALDPPGGRWARIHDDNAWLRPFMRSAGRLDCRSLDAGFAGTAFLVGERLAITNRHVALLFARGLGTGKLDIRYKTELDHRREQRAPFDRDFIKVSRVLLIHPHWDIAIVEVEPGKDDRKPLPLAAVPFAKPSGRPVAVIGYPAVRDAESIYDEDTLMTAFGRDRGAWKRLQPGMTDGEGAWTPDDPQFPRVTAHRHNASTLAGNSGSVVVDLDAQIVMGVHFAGEKYEANYFVPTWKLYADPRIRELNLSFKTDPATPVPPLDPEVEAAWAKLDKPARLVSVPETVGGHEAAGPAPSGDDWFERASDEAIRAAVRAAPARVRAVIGADQLRVLGQPLRDEPDDASAADLPEIILVHGFLGAHLDAAAGVRSWVAPGVFVRGALATELVLADGDDVPGRRVEPAGLVQAIYRTAAMAWRRAGFVVHEVAFDWRRRTELAADRLHHTIERIAAGGRRELALVAHSTGAAVACVYAQRHAAWRDRIRRAVLIGPPLAGTYAAVELLLSTHPLLTKLDLVGAGQIDDLGGMMRSFPGITDQLPDPAVFADAEPLYRASAWPDRKRPPQSHLDHARNLKHAIRTSPLLERTSIIAAIGRPTVDRLAETSDAPGWTTDDATGVGDGVVPARSAVLGGGRVGIVEEDHWFLPAAPRVQLAVAELLANGALPDDLRREPTDEQLRARAPVRPEVLHDGTELHDGAEASTKAALRTGLDWDALRWLLSSDLTSPGGGG